MPTLGYQYEFISTYGIQHNYLLQKRLYSKTIDTDTVPIFLQGELAEHLHKNIMKLLTLQAKCLQHNIEECVLMYIVFISIK